MRRHSKTFNFRSPRWTETEEQKLCQSLADGLSWNNISTILHRSIPACRKRFHRLKKAGVRLQTDSTAHLSLLKDSDSSDQEMINGSDSVDSQLLADEKNSDNSANENQNEKDIISRESDNSRPGESFLVDGATSWTKYLNLQFGYPNEGRDLSFMRMYNILN